MRRRQGLASSGHYPCCCAHLKLLRTPQKWHAFVFFEQAADTVRAHAWPSESFSGMACMKCGWFILQLSDFRNPEHTLRLEWFIGRSEGITPVNLQW